MQVQKLGDRLAVTLSDEVVETLQLREGDDVSLTVGPDRTLEIRRELSREAAVARFLSRSYTVPPGFKFSRDEANER